MLQEIRKLKGMSQSQLAEKSLVAIKTIQKYESGERDIKKASVDIVSKLATALECEVDDIINPSREITDTVKIEKALNKVNCFKGDSTSSAILDLIPQALFDNLESDDLVILIDTVNTAYQKGKASTGAEMIDDNTVWISKLQRAIEI